ncbi:MAG: serine/threonine protein kinase, partial [Myxococcales bacterium]|nr:serine/threonine protein kinase [Myxococcales bacterium]
MDDAQTLDGVRGADTCTIVDGELVAPERAPATRGAALGRYLVIEQVGEGGMGVVLRAYDPKLHRELALKQLHRGALDSDGEARLMREAQAMAQLSHPNVVTIYDVERTDDGVVMAMEYAEGQTLARWMADGPRPWREVLERFEQAGRGLQAAHDAGLVHRDFKPSNAIVGPEGRVRVMDFGLARAERGPGLEPSRTTHDEGQAERVSDEPTGAGPDLEHSASGSLSMQLTQAGAVMGTPGYMAPEQHRGETADARSDQYAFCVSMWEALVGERPFHGDFRGIVLAKHQGPPPLPRGSKVPRHAHEALRRGLQPKAEDRWPSMRALLEELGRDPARRRRRWLRAGAWLGGAVGLGAVGLWAWPRSDARPCQDATAQLRGVWDDARRAEVEAALRGTATSYADGTVVRVTERLDAYAEAWAAQHT